MKSSTDFQEYTPTGSDSPWRIEDWAGLAKEFALTKEDLPEFHAIAEKHRTGWRVVRMMWGLNPVIPNPQSDVDYLRTFTEAEVAHEMGVDKKQIRPQLFAVIQAWAKHQMGKSSDQETEVKVATATAKRKAKEKQQQAPEQLPLPAPPSNSPPPAISQEEVQLLLKYGFTMDEFGLPGRSAQARDLELRWFIERLIELRKMFDEPMAKSLARQAIVNELSTRRCDAEMMKLRPSDDRYWSIQETKLKIERIYKEQWGQLEEICPYIKHAVGKRTFSQVLSEVVEAHREFESSGNKELIDGFFTATEIQIEMRQSQQAGPRYRPGLVAAIAEARAGLFDPNWCRKIPDSHLKMLDHAYREANKSLVDAGVIAPIDLEGEGPGSEYPPLFIPEPAADPDSADPISVPEESVPLDDAPEAPAKE